jgi:O-antigen/teichoic acid export membrane protein
LSDNIEEKEAEAAEAPKPKSQIIRNVLVNWTAFLVTLLTGFWMAPFLVKHLGESVYGVWVLTGSLVGYLGLLDFGVTQSTVKYIAEYRARNDQNAINRVITGGFYVFSAVGAFSLLVSLFLALFFNRFFPTTLPDSTVAIVVGLVGLNIAITFPCSVFLGVLRGYQRYDIGAAANSVSVLVRSGFIVWAVLNNYGIIALAALTLIFDMARLAYVIQRVYQINPDIRIGREFFYREELGKLFGHSVWVFLIMVGDQINFYTDAVIIGLFLPPAAITVYSIAFRLVGYLRSMVVEMVGVLMPAVSSMHAQEDSKGVADLLVAGAKFTLILALPAAAVFMLLGDRFIELWMDRDYPQSALILSILTIGIIAHLCEMTVTTVLVGTGHAHIVARWVIAQSVINLILSLVLIKPFGLVGVALGTSISMVGFAVISIPIYFHHHLKQSLSSFVRHAMLLPICVQIPWVTAIFLLREFIQMPTMSSFFGPILLLSPLYGAIVFAVCLNPSEKAAVAGKFGFKRRLQAE